ncbi:MAG: UDP-N-acetylmuramoyl-L-alanine--D-glutamate ligase, partial [Lutibacter sp.]
MNVVVLGSGESGFGAALLAQKNGDNVFVSDRGAISKSYKEVLINNEINFEENNHTVSKILEADVVVKSPGIPDGVPLIELLKGKGISVVSEIEFAWQYCKSEVIAITGSNGKTTTTMLVNHILNKAGLNVVMGGNIGTSFAKLVAEQIADYAVLEVSSFQLDGIVNFKPHIAIITNITPDHLDRYNNSFENYINSKFRITENQTETDYLIYDYDDEVITNWLNNHEIKAKKMPFSISKE